jgi:hypothetical protein
MENRVRDNPIYRSRNKHIFIVDCFEKIHANNHQQIINK